MGDAVSFFFFSFFFIKLFRLKPYVFLPGSCYDPSSRLWGWTSHRGKSNSYTAYCLTKTPDRTLVFFQLSLRARNVQLKLRPE